MVRRSAISDGVPPRQDGEDPEVLSCPNSRIPAHDVQLALHLPDPRAGGVPRHREARRDLGRRPPPGQADEHLQVAAIQCRHRGCTYGVPDLCFLLRGCLPTPTMGRAERGGDPDRRWCRAAGRRQRNRRRDGVSRRVVNGHLGPPGAYRASGSHPGRCVGPLGNRSSPTAQQGRRSASAPLYRSGGGLYLFAHRGGNP